MLYNLEAVLQHSAKGSTWSKHKYIKKVNGRYYYPTYKSHVDNKHSDSNGYYKVGDKYYTIDNINSGISKMKAADEYNSRASLTNSRYTNSSARGLQGEKFLKKRDSSMESARETYENEVSKINDFQKKSEEQRSFGDRVTLKALNASASFKNKISKGKRLVENLFKKRG